MTTGTVRLHRVLRTKPEKIYRGFVEPDAIAKWIPSYGFTCTVQQMDTQVDDTLKMSFTNFTTSNSHSFGGKYLELVPGEKLCYTDTIDDPNLPGEMSTTVTLSQVLYGTAINVAQEDILAVIPTEMCYLGWQESPEQLAKLVEPDITE